MADPGSTGPGTRSCRGLCPANSYAHSHRNAPAHICAVACCHGHHSPPADGDNGSTHAHPQTDANARPNTSPRCHSTTHTITRRGTDGGTDARPHSNTCACPNCDTRPTHANPIAANSCSPSWSLAHTRAPGQGSSCQDVLRRV